AIPSKMLRGTVRDKCHHYRQKLSRSIFANGSIVPSMKISPTTKSRIKLPPASRWHWALLTLCLIGIAVHFALRWAGLPRVIGWAAADIPLLSVIVIGGIPLVLQILRKLLHRDFGADLLAALALVTA